MKIKQYIFPIITLVLFSGIIWGIGWSICEHNRSFKSDYIPAYVNKNIELKSVIRSNKFEDVYLYNYKDESGEYLITTKGYAVSTIKIK